MRRRHLLPLADLFPHISIIHTKFPLESAERRDRVDVGDIECPMGITFHADATRPAFNAATADSIRRARTSGANCQSAGIVPLGSGAVYVDGADSRKVFADIGRVGLDLAAVRAHLGTLLQRVCHFGRYFRSYHLRVRRFRTVPHLRSLASVTMTSPAVIKATARTCRGHISRSRNEKDLSRNGKSTYLTMVINFLGKTNTSAVSLHRLESDRFSVARLIGKLANICADLPSEHLEGTSIFKAITGGDAVEAEYKFRDSFQFEPYCRLVFSANLPPRSNDASEGFFDRWLVVPFDARFRGDAKRENSRAQLDAELSQPAELSGLLNRAIEAWHRIRATERLSEHESVQAAARDFRSTTDPFAVWLDRFTVDDPDAAVPKDTLRAAYGAACAQAGRPTPTDKAFTQALFRHRPNQIERKQKTVNGKVRWCYVGIGLTGDPTDRSHDSQVSQDSPYLVSIAGNSKSDGDVESGGEGVGDVEQVRVNPINVVNAVNSNLTDCNHEFEDTKSDQWPWEVSDSL